MSQGATRDGVIALLLSKAEAQLIALRLGKSRSNFGYSHSHIDIEEGGADDPAGFPSDHGLYLLVEELVDKLIQEETGS